MPHPLNKPCPRARLFWLVIIQLHWIAAVAVLLAMPRGFPVGHPHWWANEVCPWIVIAYAVFTTLAALRGRWRNMVTLMLASPIALIGGAIAGLLIFPISGRWASVEVVVVAIVVMIGLRREFYPWWPARRKLAAMLLLPLLFGATLPFSQQAAAPETHPAAMTAIPALSPLAGVLMTQRISPAVRVVPSTGEILYDLGGRSMQVSPLLTFESRSPDRCWTNLASKALRTGRRRALCAATAGRFEYLDVGYSTLTVEASGDVVNVRATSVLPAPVYSHLNTYTEATIVGHRKLSLSFSPAPQTQIDVQYSEYPTGRPARMAYLDAAEVFHVVEASSGEKGPFHELAAGPLKRSEPLTITLLDEGTPFASMTLANFSAQASTQLSPTAGWGLPVNAIEFSLYDDNPRSAAGIFITLAATSVGRGWDSVGHSAGTYTNRLELRAIAEK